MTARPVAVSLALLVVAIAWGCGGSKPKVSKPVPKPTFTISKETTLFTEPLDADGYVDYETALNERLRGKTNPDDNAVVLLVQALGPKPEGRELPASFYRWLGVNAPPEGGQYLVSNSWHFRAEMNNDDDNSFGKRQAELTKSIWKVADDPKHAKLLNLNEKPLSLAVEASKRSAYFHPLVRPNRGGQNLLFSAPLPVSAKVRELAWMLCLRATLHAGEGRQTEAWTDVFAALRLGRLVSQGGSTVESLIGVASEGTAMSVVLVLLEQTRPSAAAIRAYHEEYSKLPPRMALDAKLAVTDRVSFLELTQTIYRNGLQTLRNLENDDVKLGEPDETDELLRVAVNWDVPLKAFQHWFDRFATAHVVKTRAERAKAWATIKDELHNLVDEDELPNLRERLKKQSQTGISPEMSEKFADILVSKLMPNTPRVSEAFYRVEQQTRILHLAFALAAYHADNKKYPATLEALAPKYIEKIPDDLCAGKPLIYKPTDAGYLLYSVGVNGVDDGGQSYGDDPPGDDLVVRIPSQIKK